MRGGEIGEWGIGKENAVCLLFERREEHGCCDIS
jgi:hypothetical protein